jgi:hypothetical protein
MVSFQPNSYENAMPGCIGWLKTAIIEAGGSRVALLNILTENGFDFQGWALINTGSKRKIKRSRYFIV